LLHPLKEWSLRESRGGSVTDSHPGGSHILCEPVPDLTQA